MTDRDQVLAIIRDHCIGMRITYDPEMLVNGDKGFYGEDAEDLIYAAAERINLPRDEVDRRFPYWKYFEPEAGPAMWPFQLVKLLFKPRFIPPTYEPLTAAAFADLMVSLKQNAGPA